MQTRNKRKSGKLKKNKQKGMKIENRKQIWLKKLEYGILGGKYKEICKQMHSKKNTDVVTLF